jgi:hypothetical protein
VFWKKGRSIAVISGMIFSLGAMTAIQLLPKLDCTKGLWMKIVGTGIFWPWYTLTGFVVTLFVAWLVQRMFPPMAEGSEVAVSRASKSTAVE